MLSVYILLWLSIDIHRYKQKTWQTHATCSGARMRRRTLPTFPTVFCNEFLPCSSSVSCQCISIVTGWWLTYPSEKYESQLGLLFPTEWKVIIQMFQTTNQIPTFLFVGCFLLFNIAMEAMAHRNRWCSQLETSIYFEGFSSSLMLVITSEMTRLVRQSPSYWSSELVWK